MHNPISHCSFPVLSQPYAQALYEAVAFILKRYAPVGIIAAGSILRGSPDKASDLDLYVIHTATYRQRLQRFFNGVPTEVFVNPPFQVERYFASEHSSGRPITAHMLASGFLILGQDEIVDQLCSQARTWLAKSPLWSQEQLTWTRYFAGNLYEDGLDLAERDPAAAQVFLSKAVIVMLEYYFKAHSLFLPRAKELLTCLAEHDPQLAQAGRGFFTSEGFDVRLRLAEQIADATIGVHGFFEWDSSPEEVSPG